MNIKVAVPLIEEVELEAVREVLLSGNFVSGKRVKAFEEEFAKYTGTKHAISCNSGTAAVHMALLSLGVGPGDEVIVPSISFFATASAVMMCGATPIFSEVREDSNMDCRGIEKLISPKTKAILPVHLFGLPADMREISAIADHYNIPVIEDCAQAHGARYHEKVVGNLSTAGCFSFFATKNMTTLEGGMVTTNDDHINKMCRLYRSHGMPNRKDHIVLGYNYRMNEVEAAIGLEQLKKLNVLNDIRIKNVKYMSQRIKRFEPPKVPFGKTHVYFWYPIQIIHKYNVNKFMDYLTENGIGYRFRYSVPLYKQPIFKNEYARVCHPVAESMSGAFVGLPNHPLLTQEEMDYIISIVNKWVG